MASCARREIVRPGEAGIFHCWQRCVRRAYLLGKDPLTGKDHTHRREWFIERLRLLVSCYAIDVAFEAILSNHFHLVLRANPRLVKRMGDFEVARRYLRVYPGTRVLDGNWIEPTDKQIEALVANKKKLAFARKQLSNVSSFMAALSEYIARRANHEDGCDGRFFSGRFSCREVTHEGGLLVTGLYTDLNLIRAGEALTPESSVYTSAWFRIQARQAAGQGESAAGLPIDSWLAPLTLEADHLGDVPCTSGQRASDKGLLSLTGDQYLQMLDWSGRQLREGKRGAIPSHLAPILERLGIEGDELLDMLTDLPRLFRRIVGRSEEIIERAHEVGRRWLHGVRPAARLFRVHT
jgi:hypothetical protein